MFHFRNQDFVRNFNRVFANVDTYFRDFEREHGVRGLFPTITVPSILNAFDEIFSSEETDEKVTFYQNGKVHREDGPAVVYKSVKNKDGKVAEKKDDEYWLDGKQVTKEVVDALVAKREDEKEYVVYIGDVEYKVKGKKKLEEIQKLLK